MFIRLKHEVQCNQATHSSAPHTEHSGNSQLSTTECPVLGAATELIEIEGTNKRYTKGHTEPKDEIAEALTLENGSLHDDEEGKLKQ